MKCRHCAAELSLQMIDLGAAPPSNAFNATPDEPEQHYPLRVLVCEQCWLAQTDISLFKLDYDGLFTVENAKGAVVAAVLSLALSAGFLKAGDPQSGGIA